MLRYSGWKGKGISCIVSIGVGVLSWSWKLKRAMSCWHWEIVNDPWGDSVEVMDSIDMVWLIWGLDVPILGLKLYPSG